MNSFQRTRRLRAVIDDPSNTPHEKATAQQLAGEALLAAALPRRQSPLPGTASRNGITGGALMIVVGVVIALATNLSHSDPYPDGVTVVGKVTGIHEYRSTDTSNRSTRTTCSQTVTYNVGKASYTVESRNRSSSACSSAGSEVKVSYRPQEPAAGRVLDGGGTKLLLFALSLAGIALAVGGAATIAVRGAGALTGRRWASEGRQALQANFQGSGPGGNPELVQRLCDAWSGSTGSPTGVGAAGGTVPDAGQSTVPAWAQALPDGHTSWDDNGLPREGGAGWYVNGIPISGLAAAAGAMRDAVTGIRTNSGTSEPAGAPASTGTWGGEPLQQPAQQPATWPPGQQPPGQQPGAGPAPAPAPPQTAPTGPAPGWYRDPAGSGAHRWWDGTRWTEHTR